MNIPDDIQKVREADVSKYRSKPLMTKYEFDQLIGLRTTHLSRGATPFVDLPENFTIKSNMEFRKIALMEMREGKLPYLVKRTLPFGKPECEYWKLSDLDLTSVRNLLRD
jgi:DNA-directed RNA polymerase subunit K/omega